MFLNLHNFRLQSEADLKLILVLKMILPSDYQKYSLTFSFLLHKKDRLYRSKLLSIWLPYLGHLKAFPFEYHM